MSSPPPSIARRLQSMVERGLLEPDEAARLQGATVGLAPAGATWANPFVRFGGEKAATMGVLIALLSAFVSRGGLRYDGAFDTHKAKQAVSWGTALFDQILALPLSALVFWLVASVLGSKGRYIDQFGAVGLSRLPYLLMGALLLQLQVGDLSNGHLSPAVAAVVLTSLFALTWNFVWLFRGFKNASGLLGAKLVRGFIVSIVLAETLSKIALTLVRP